MEGSPRYYEIFSGTIRDLLGARFWDGPAREGPPHLFLRGQSRLLAGWSRLFRITTIFDPFPDRHALRWTARAAVACLLPSRRCCSPAYCFGEWARPAFHPFRGSSTR